MMSDVSLDEDWQQISPVFLQVVPKVEEVQNPVQFFLKSFDSFTESFRCRVARDRINLERALCEI